MTSAASAGDASRMADSSAMMSICDAVHLVLIKTEPAGETHLVSSHYLEWRPVLAAPGCRCTMSIEMMGIGEFDVSISIEMMGIGECDVVSMSIEIMGIGECDVVSMSIEMMGVLELKLMPGLCFCNLRQREQGASRRARAEAGADAQAE